MEDLITDRYSMYIPEQLSGSSFHFPSFFNNFGVMLIANPLSHYLDGIIAVFES